MSMLIKAARVTFWMQIINTEDVVKEKSQLFFLRLDGWRKKSRNHWSYNSGLIILGSVEDSVLWCSLFCSCVLTSELHPSLLSPWLSLLALSVQGPFPLLFHAFFRDWALSRETAKPEVEQPLCWGVGTFSCHTDVAGGTVLPAHRDVSCAPSCFFPASYFRIPTSL